MSELIFDNAEACMEVAKLMLENGHYVVMISREEELWILNYVYSENCNRNDVVFMDLCEFEEKYAEINEFGEDD